MPKKPPSAAKAANARLLDAAREQQSVAAVKGRGGLKAAASVIDDFKAENPVTSGFWTLIPAEHVERVETLLDAWHSGELRGRSREQLLDYINCKLATQPIAFAAFKYALEKRRCQTR